MNGLIKSCFHPEKGTWVLLSFIAFFGVIVAVNTVFITLALRTHSGVVTEHPYKKGLAFNTMLEKAKMQANEHIKNEVTYANGVLRWEFPIKNAAVTAHLIRPVQQGYDFSIALQYTGDGVYEAPLKLPLIGAWSANLKATWNNQDYQTSLEIMAQ